MAAKSTFNSSQNDVFGNMSDDDDDDDLNFNLDGSGFGSDDDEEETNQQSSSMSDDLFDDDLPSSDEDADPYTDPNDIFNQMSDDDDDDEDDEIQEPDEPPAPAPQPTPAPKKPAARHRGRPRKTQQEPVAPKQQAQIPTTQPAQSPQPADDYFNDNTDDMQSMQVIDDYQQQPDDAAYYQNQQQQTMPTDDNNMQSYDYNQQYEMASQSNQQAQPNNNAYMQAQSQQAMYEQQYAQQDNNPFMQDTQQQSQVNHQPAHAQAPKPFAAPQEPAVSAWHGETPNPNMIQRIIAVSDSIRNDLSSDEKNAVRAVMNAKQISGDDLADLTYAVLTARKSTMTALEELLTARNKDIASRVFYLLRLNDDDLQTIYNIGIAFDAQKDTMSGSSLDHYAISEQANQAVSTLSDNSIDLLQAVYNIYNKSKALMNG